MIPILRVIVLSQSSQESSSDELLELIQRRAMAPSRDKTSTPSVSFPPDQVATLSSWN